MRADNADMPSTGRILIKRSNHNDVKNMKVYLVRIEPSIFGCENVLSLDSGFDCSSGYTLGHGLN